MTKTIILSALAFLSLTLSYFFEVTPANSASLETVVITPYAINSPEDIVNALALDAPEINTDEITEEEYYFAKKLGLRFRHSNRKELIETVTAWVGTPYRYGSNTKKGTDCSGFVTRIYQDVYGIDLSRSSSSMFQDVKRVKKDSVKTGDLVFFRRGPKQPVFHVGIYLKEGKFIHAATSKGVMVNSLNEPYYKNYYFAAGRVN
jgi:cell wall-associated NlpC family hydrolase